MQASMSQSSLQFNSTLSRDVLGGLPIPRQILKFLLPNRVPPEGRDSGVVDECRPLRTRGPSGH
jgi:hypothetical protein